MGGSARPTAAVRDGIPALARRTVAGGILLCLPVMAAIWFADASTDVVVRWAFPPLAGYLLGFAWVLLRRPRLARRAALTSLVLLEATWLVVLWVRLRTAEDAATGWADVFPLPLLDVVVCLVVGFLFQHTTRALVHGALYVLAVLLTGGAALLGAPGGTALLGDLGRYGTYLLVVLVLLLVLSRAKERLARAVHAAEQAEATATRLRDLAYRDELTGTANRRRLVEELGHQAALVGPGRPVCLVYFDLDRFKDVNDSLGHEVGDQVLRVVARTAGELVREGDLLARLGGEEFVVVTPGIGPDGAAALAERMRAALPDRVERAVGVPVTASFGVAPLRPGEQAVDALQRVDSLMYRAKQSGRDRVTVGLSPA